MAIFSNPMDYIGKLDDENDSLQDGSVTYHHKNGASAEFSFTYSNYAPDFATPSGVNIPSLLSINCSGYCYRAVTIWGTYPKSYNTVSITVTALDSKMPACYSGTLSFTADNKNVVIGNKTYSNSSDARKAFLPFKMDWDENSYYQNSSYGWWSAE